LLRYGSAGLMTRLLPVLDDFERAFQTLPRGLDRLTWSEGIALIHRKLQILLESEGLEAIDAAGQQFNPAFHEAISYEEREDLEDGAIIAEVQKGYKLGERVLRPSLVRVAKHTKAEEKAPDQESGEQGE
jgi:molecular chaperone GrpE